MSLMPTVGAIDLYLSLEYEKRKVVRQQLQRVISRNFSFYLNIILIVIKFIAIIDCKCEERLAKG